MLRRRAMGMGMFDSPQYWQRVKSLFGSALLAYYPLDEASGTVARDISGNGKHGGYTGVTVGGETNPLTGKKSPTWGGANGQFVSLNSSGLTLSLDEGTVICLAKPATGIMAEAASRDLFYFAYSTGSEFVTTAKRAAYIMSEKRFISSAYRAFNDFGYLKDDVWSLVISTWSVSNNAAKVYVNNNLAITSTTGTAAAGAPNQMLLGAAGASSESWKGSLSDYAILNRFITLAEAQAVYRYLFGGTAKRVSLIGDSVSTNAIGWQGWTFGTYASNKTTITNHAAAGATIASQMAGQVTASASDSADIIVIELGTNDNNAGNMTTLQATAETQIAALKASNPNATIYWMNVLPRWADNTTGAEVDKGNIRTAIAAACTAQSITCWDTYTDPWIAQNQTSDGLHPTAAGYSAIATRILALL